MGAPATIWRLLLPLGMIALGLYGATGTLPGHAPLDAAPAATAIERAGLGANPPLPTPVAAPAPGIVRALNNLVNPADRVVDGVVVDEETDQPVAGVRISGGLDDVQSDPSGRFHVTRLRPEDQIVATAPGYIGRALTVGEGGHVRLALQPQRRRVEVRDAYSGGPIADALVALGGQSARTEANGIASLRTTDLSGPVRVSAAGYAETEVSGSGTDVKVRLRPNSLRGQVIDAHTGERIQGAQVQVGGATVTTDLFGSYTLGDVPEAGQVEVWAKGYVRARAEVPRSPVLDVRLEPLIVKGVYLSYHAVADRELRGHVIDLIKRTELNALVLDVKGDYGRLSYAVDVPLAREIGATEAITIDDIDAFLRELRAANIYTIARIVVFKDNLLARGHPEWAIIDRRTGDPWIDDENLAWTDPFRTEVWDYNVALATDAARHGFDEVQFDYIRFPTDGSVGNAVYARENTEANRVAALVSFLSKVRAALAPYRTAIAIDTFGYTTLREDDMGIGQQIEALAPYIDFLCPMVYPSTFGSSIPGVANPVAQPYDIIFQTTQRAIRRLRGTGARVRPWLQDFNDYAFDRRVYGQREVKAQIQAADDAGAPGWLLWDPRNRYTAAALAPKTGR